MTAVAERSHFDNPTSYAALPDPVSVTLPFWSLTVYDLDTKSHLQIGQPLPSLNQMDKSVADPDCSTLPSILHMDRGARRRSAASVQNLR